MDDTKSHSTSYFRTDGGNLEEIYGIAGHAPPSRYAGLRKGAIEEMDDEKLATLVDSLMDETRVSYGKDLAFEATDKHDQQTRDLHKQYLMMSLRRGVFGDEPIAVDVDGRLDVDYGNPGPEIKMQQQITSTGLLSAIYDEEIQATDKQERYRGLSLFPRAALRNSVLEAEIKALEEDDDIHSVSVISMNQDYDGEFPPCSFDCWLKDPSAIPGLPNLPNLLPTYRSEAADETRGKSILYATLESKQTRLLHIQPGRYGEPIVCSLSVISVLGPDAAHRILPAYEALSYTWGDPSPKFSIQCNSHSLPVAHNLFFALQHIRLEKETRHVWVDAICINQDDVQERNAQVLYMLQIYQNAARTMVWLGEEADGSCLALESMKHLDQRDPREAITLRRHKPTCHDQLRRIYEAQSRLFGRPWFRRSWIRQEISVSKDVTVMCGRSTIRWYTMKRSAARLGRLYEKMGAEGMSGLPEFPDKGITAVSNLRRGWIYGQSAVKSIGTIRSIWYYHTGGFLDLLMAGREYDATDPRDKVYSVLGLVRVATAEPSYGLSAETAMPVDYSRSVSEVYQDVVKYFVNRDRDLDILAILLSHRNAASDEDLPSWVPDWRIPTSEIPLMAHRDFISTKLAAGGFLVDAKLQSFSETGILRVEGWVVDTINQIDNFSADVHSVLDTLPGFNKPPGIQEQECDDECDSDECNSDDDDAAFGQRSRAEGLLYAEPFDPEKHRTRCCITASGRHCLAPAGARVGDDVALVLGSKLPFIFRQDGANTLASIYPDIPSVVKFRLIGPCVVPDIMFGSLVSEFQEAALKPAQFVLV